MTSTFRLMRAEFKKIFKRPSVYLMAIILVLSIFLSLYIFKPTPANDYTINYGKDLTAYNYYDYFFNKDLETSEKGINASFDSVDTNYSYYSLSKERDDSFVGYHDSIIELINKIRTETDGLIKDENYNKLKIELTKYSDSSRNYSQLLQFPHISFTANSETCIDNYTKTIVSLKDYANSHTSFEFIEFYDTNQKESKLIENRDAIINYINPTLQAFSKDIKDTYIKYTKIHNEGGNSENLFNLEKQRKLLLEKTNNLKTYLDTLIDNEFPIILIKEQDKNKIYHVLEESIQYLNSFNFIGSYATMTEYSNLNTNLVSIDFANFFTNIFSNENTPIYQVKLTDTNLELFNKVKNKVDENKAIIKSSINTLKDSNTINEIQFKITEYYLLSEAYQSFINDSIILEISKNYTSNEFAKFYGYNINEFNIYQYNERIATNKYYISNNVYSNSFATNFSFNQNSKNETSVYDFMYFSMEISTIIITIFSMLLICSLITSETENGTIKLLLVRPYKRSKIMTAKLFATIFFTFTFMLFSAILSFAGGYYIFGMSNTNILAIFNSNTPIVISPLVLMIIDILSLFAEAIFFILIGLMIATLCKNYAGSIYICLIFMITMYVLNALFGGAFWYSFFPSSNLHLFKYFGNAFTSLAESSIIQNLIITPIQSSMNFLYSVLITFSYSLIAIAISYAVFNKRDF